MREGEELYLWCEQRREVIEIESAVIAHGHKAKPRAGSFGQQLPWYQIAVVLHFREQDDIPFANKFPAPCLGNEIDAFSGSAREHDLVSARNADVFGHALARFFISFRCARAQHMQPAMDICVFVFVVTVKRVEDSPRL